MRFSPSGQARRPSGRLSPPTRTRPRRCGCPMSCRRSCGRTAAARCCSAGTRWAAVRPRTPRARVARALLLVTTMQPADGLRATDSTAVTTDGDLVYASADRLYVATSRWGTVGPMRPLGGIAWRGTPATGGVTTEIHSFDTSSASTTRYVGTGSVPGYVLGRWALSEYQGTLRVATTRQPPWTGRGRRPQLFDDRQARRARRCPRRDRPGRGAGQDRADPGRALFR